MILSGPLISVFTAFYSNSKNLQLEKEVKRGQERFNSNCKWAILTRSNAGSTMSLPIILMLIVIDLWISIEAHVQIKLERLDLQPFVLTWLQFIAIFWFRRALNLSGKKCDNGVDTPHHNFLFFRFIKKKVLFALNTRRSGSWGLSVMQVLCHITLHMSLRNRVCVRASCVVGKYTFTVTCFHIIPRSVNW